MKNEKAKPKANKAALTSVGHEESMHVSVRKISNGFLMSHSKMGPKGYESTETYHPKMPDMGAFDLAAVGKAEGKKAPRET